jgi:DUF971 family protein
VSSLVSRRHTGAAARRERRQGIDRAPGHPGARALQSPHDLELPAWRRPDTDREARSLGIEWADGHVTTFDFEQFRLLCPCAYCRGEAGLPGWLDSNPTLTGEQTRLVSIDTVGGYAIAPAWGDGHHTGYYTYTDLRAQCPCQSCSAARAAGGHAVTPGGFR